MSNGDFSSAMQGIGRRKTAHSPPSSNELIEAYRASGSPKDFEQIVQRFAALVFSECRRVTANSHDAEDASQLVFLALAIQIKSGTNIERLPSWLQRVAQRQALKIVRARTRHRRREDAARRREMQVADLDGEMDSAVTAGIVRDAIDQLHEKYRLPVILHYFGGLNLDQVAVELKLKRQAVATRLFRGRKMLAEQLGRQGMKLDDNTLVALLAVAVPTAVVSSVMASVHSQPMPVAAASLHITIADTLRAVAMGGMGRGLRIALVAGVLAMGGSTMAWVVGGEAIEQIKKLDVRPLIRRMFQAPSAPRLVVSAQEQSLPAAPQRVEIPGAPGAGVRISRSEPARDQGERLAKPQAAKAAAVVNVQRPGVVAPPPVVRAAPAPRLNVNLPVAPMQPVRVAAIAPGDHLVIGEMGQQRVEVKQPNLQAEKVTLGAQAGSRGVLHLGGNTLTVGAGGITVGAQGTGELYLGTANRPGKIRSAPGAQAPLMIGGSAGGRGKVQGWGTVETNGPVVNNGQVIADGFDHYRDLDLSKVTTVSGTMYSANAAGWFVQRGGKVKLPAIQIKPGTGTYTWGDNGEGQLDLINSMQIKVEDQPQESQVGIALRTVALNDPLDLTMPPEMSVISLYEVQADESFAPSRVGVMVRYSEAAANTIAPGEDSLTLLASSGGEWQMASDLSVDTLRNYVGGEFDSTFDYLAIGVPWGSEAVMPSGIFRLTSSDVGSTVPEPSGLMLLGGMALAALHRRRRVS
jgi:RNA polymerase sigma factor (sigma-70 family)